MGGRDGIFPGYAAEIDGVFSGVGGSARLGPSSLLLRVANARGDLVSLGESFGEVRALGDSCGRISFGL